LAAGGIEPSRSMWAIMPLSFPKVLKALIQKKARNNGEYPAFGFIR
jgi:hypothetical protein